MMSGPVDPPPHLCVPLLCINTPKYLYIEPGFHRKMLKNDRSKNDDSRMCSNIRHCLAFDSCSLQNYTRERFDFFFSLWPNKWKVKTMHEDFSGNFVYYIPYSYSGNSICGLFFSGLFFRSLFYWSPLSLHRGEINIKANSTGPQNIY